MSSNLSTLRKRLGLTQVQLARIFGVTQSCISGRETGAQATPREAVMAMLYLKTLPRHHLDALLEDPAFLTYLENL